MYLGEIALIKEVTILLCKSYQSLTLYQQKFMFCLCKITNTNFYSGYIQIAIHAGRQKLPPDDVSLVTIPEIRNKQTLMITSINVSERKEAIRNYIERCNALENVYDYIQYLSPGGEAAAALSNLSTALPFKN